jgi:archaetidylinositol phosphate synthase
LRPVAGALTGVHPNTITYVALAAGLLAGVCYWATDYHAAFFFVGGALVALSGVLDSLDGMVARMHARSSRAGDFLDHFFDRLVNIAIVLGLSLSPRADLRLGLAMTILMVLNSYMGTQIQASFGKRFYSGLGKAELFVGLVLGSAFLGFVPDASVAAFGVTISVINLFLALVGVSSCLGIVHRFRLGLRLAAGENGD